MYWADEVPVLGKRTQLTTVHNTLRVTPGHCGGAGGGNSGNVLLWTRYKTNLFVSWYFSSSTASDCVSHQVSVCGRQTWLHRQQQHGLYHRWRYRFSFSLQSRALPQYSPAQYGRDGRSGHSVFFLVGRRSEAKSVLQDHHGRVSFVRVGKRL